MTLLFLAFLPQFAGSGGPGSFLALGVTYALITLVITGATAHFSGALGGWLKSRLGLARALRYATGGILVGLGAKLALSERW